MSEKEIITMKGAPAETAEENRGKAEFATEMAKASAKAMGVDIRDTVDAADVTPEMWASFVIGAIEPPENVYKELLVPRNMPELLEILKTTRKKRGEEFGKSHLKVFKYMKVPNTNMVFKVLVLEGTVDDREADEDNPSGIQGVITQISGMVMDPEQVVRYLHMTATRLIECSDVGIMNFVIASNTKGISGLVVASDAMPPGKELAMKLYNGLQGQVDLYAMEMRKKGIEVEGSKIIVPNRSFTR